MNMREELKAFVDNELPEERRAEILRALENDPALQAEVIELRQMSRMIHEEAWQPEPRGLEQTLTALTARKNKTPWWIRPQVGWVLGAACCLALAMVLFPPVFSQAKMAAKHTALLAESREEKAGATWSPQAPLSNGSPDLTQKQDVYGQSTNVVPPSPASAAASKARYRGADALKDPTLHYSPSETPLSSEAQDQGSLRVPGSPKAPDSDTEAYFSRDKAGINFNGAEPRYLIKQADLAVEVPDVPKAQHEAESIANSVGGRVESSVKNAQEGALASAELTLRVPVSRFETAVNRTRNLGRVLSDAISGADVTTQVVDAEARLKVLRAEEDQYVELLRSTKKVGEVLSVKERLSQVRQEIESLDATRKVLRNQAAESAINLSLTERPSTEKPVRDENWLEGVWAKAVSGLSAAGRAIGAAVVFIFVYSPIWLPILFIGWLVARRARK